MIVDSVSLCPSLAVGADEGASTLCVCNEVPQPTQTSTDTIVDRASRGVLVRACYEGAKSSRAPVRGPGALDGPPHVEGRATAYKATESRAAARRKADGLSGPLIGESSALMTGFRTWLASAPAYGRVGLEVHHTTVSA